jgi:hypothetical protein
MVRSFRFRLLWWSTPLGQNSERLRGFRNPFVARHVFGRLVSLPPVRLRLPAQTVDATPSSVLIQKCFPRRSGLFGCPRSKPSQCGVPADLAERAFLALVFNARRVRAECCIDLLRPPRLSGLRDSHAHLRIKATNPTRDATQPSDRLASHVEPVPTRLQAQHLRVSFLRRRT